MVGSKEAYYESKKVLQQAGIEDAEYEAKLLMEYGVGISRFTERMLTAEEWENLQLMVTRRTHKEPLQYLLGSWPFMDIELAVGPGVLIPRPETEEVCLAAIEQVKAAKAPTVLDLCSGTGALALAILYAIPTAKVTAVEKSEQAFVYLKRNCDDFRQHYNRQVRAVKADALAYYNTLTNNSIDLIVSNPPYVTVEEYRTLAPELYYEPEMALVAKENGLLFYKEISRSYKGILCSGGSLVFEIGNTQGKAVCSIMEDCGYQEIQVLPDLAGNDRIVMGKRPITINKRDKSV